MDRTARIAGGCGADVGIAREPAADPVLMKRRILRRPESGVLDLVPVQVVDDVVQQPDQHRGLTGTTAVGRNLLVPVGAVW